jgi:hypothetical protein
VERKKVRGNAVGKGGEMRKWSRKRRRKKRRILPDPFGVRCLSKSNNTAVTCMYAYIISLFLSES